MPPTEPAEIRVGTCNWLDHEEFYPAELRGARQKERLSFYARYFPLVEIDSSFYGIPSPGTVAGWVARTPDGFRFNIKPYRSLTLHERDGRTPRPPTAEEERDFLAAVVPLRESGKLGAIHYQFPPWFTDTPSARDELLRVRDRHPDDILAVEFRHRSWFEGDRAAATADLLRELDCSLVGVDAPQLGSGTVPRALTVTSPRLAIVRFHGRNYRMWYARTQTSGERFDYLYPPSELASWVPAVRAAADRGVPVHVLMNNNRSNYAVVNGFDMAHLLEIGMPRPPEPVLRRMAERDGKAPTWALRAPEPPPAGTEPGEGTSEPPRGSSRSRGAFHPGRRVAQSPELPLEPL
ncbi:MAG TPA: DUF72 domain-containing protein [Candidatus Binatia bacterium]|nr:DUF72 domain-containing protein [Candidatus Binatia bacterium]